MAGSKRQSDDSFSRMAWRLSGMGFEFVSGILGLGLAGWLVDRWVGSSPRWTLTGIALGVIGSSYNFMRQAIAAGHAAQREFDRSHPHSARSKKHSASAQEDEAPTGQPSISGQPWDEFDDWEKKDDGPDARSTGDEYDWEE